MAEHRVRLTDEDTALIVAALRARRAMSRGKREHRIDRLITRLEQSIRGNPKWVFDEYGQTHEDELDDDDQG